ncbi:hypothetical protein SmJEL517_g04645 [Synchytrium microbalum]|uniref:CUE domain-containing protein n=1 Tax=Synchytrium microbalum TaxID=1806994 RepID=A0A507BXP6_9FUNG|nr:uncharacterized protein SmJEL517_g04645 [Synchytrium microbalum]TPX32202.1 hypothetical protein SmJEL517_g04645 [Synchytrium microbalum]
MPPPSEADAIPINLPPILPLTRLSPVELTELLQFATSELSSLLNTSFQVFWSSILSPTSNSLPSFLDSYLTQCSKLLKSSHSHLNVESETTNVTFTAQNTAEHQVLSRLVFILILRLCLVDEQDQLDSLWDRDDWGLALSKLGIFSVPVIMDFVFIYGQVNAASVSVALDTLLDSHESYIVEFLNAVSVLSSTVKGMQRRREKATERSGGKSKGKGKGSGAVAVIDTFSSATSISTPNGQPPNNNSDANDEVSAEIEFLTDAIWSFEVTATVAGMTLATALIQQPDLIPTLLATYSIANLVQNSKPVIDMFDQTSLSDRVKALKGLVLSLVYHLLDSAFFQPCKLDTHNETTPAANQSPIISATEAAEKLCDLIHLLLDQAQFDEPVPFLHGAPLLVDLDVEYDLAGRLRTLKDVRLDGDDARIDYILASLEQLLAFSGNAEAKRVKKVRRMDKKRQSHQYSGADGVQASHNDGIPSYSEVPPLDEEYIRRSSLISQVQDLFPELGEGFIEACLLAFNNNAETVIMKILEDDLPDYVAKLDRLMQRTAPPPPALKRSSSIEAVVDMSLDQPDIEESVLSTRRNIFDGDEFDVFARKDVDLSMVSIGKKDKTSHILLNDPAFMQEDPFISSAAYDEMYDDEYDDTYDSTDIKLAGTVELQAVDEMETAFEKGARPSTKITMTAPDPKIESYLIKIYTSAPGAFEKSSRKSGIRGEMKNFTHWTDEQIEGWAKMLLRDTDRMESLMPGGLEPNPNHHNRHQEEEDDDDESESSDNDDKQQQSTAHAKPGLPSSRGGDAPAQRGGSSTRGRGQPRGRSYKDKHKAQIGNHNRKNASARKHRFANPFSADSGTE